jgi:aldose sugar dehydrogenase
MVWLPEGDILITERQGRILQIDSGTWSRTEIGGVPPVYADGQGGLLDITLHPKFEENGMVYLTYASGDEDANRTTRGPGPAA